MIAAIQRCCYRSTDMKSHPTLSGSRGGNLARLASEMVSHALQLIFIHRRVRDLLARFEILLAAWHAGTLGPHQSAPTSPAATNSAAPNTSPRAPARARHARPSPRAGRASAPDAGDRSTSPIRSNFPHDDAQPLPREQRSPPFCAPSQAQHGGPALPRPNPQKTALVTAPSTHDHFISI